MKPSIKGFSGAKFFAASMRGFEWSKFQPHTCSGCKVINSLGEEFQMWTYYSVFDKIRKVVNYVVDSSAQGCGKQEVACK